MEILCSQTCIRDLAHSSRVRAPVGLLPQFPSSIANLAPSLVGNYDKGPGALSPTTSSAVPLAQEGITGSMPKCTSPSQLHGETHSCVPSVSSECRPCGLLSLSWQTGQAVIFSSHSSKGLCGVRPALVTVLFQWENISCASHFIGEETEARRFDNLLKGTHTA